MLGVEMEEGFVSSALLAVDELDEDVSVAEETIERQSKKVTTIYIKYKNDNGQFSYHNLLQGEAEFTSTYPSISV